MPIRGTVVITSRVAAATDALSRLFRFGLGGGRDDNTVDSSGAGDYGSATFLAVLVVYFFFRCPPNDNNEHVRLAWAILHGHAWIDATPVHEMVRAGVHYYTLHPPLSALISLPFVAIWGLAANQTTISCVVSALDTALVWRLTRSAWLTAFFAFGTVVFYEGTLGASWGMTLIVSCLPTLLALIELQEQKRGLLVGLWAGLAALARNDLALVIPIYSLMLTKHRRDFWCGVFPVLLFYFWWNHIRLGTWMDDTLWRWYAIDEFHDQRPYGPISLYYVPFNVYVALFNSPMWYATFPWIRPNLIGESILFTSPAFLLALRAPFSDWMVRLLWLATIVALGAGMTCYANGFTQFGFRYGIQAEPFLLALMMRDKTDQFAQIMIGLSVFLVLSGTWTLRVYG